MAGDIIVSGEHLYVSGDSAGVNVTETTITIPHGFSVHIAKDCPTDWKADMYRRFKLLGGWISYTVELSNVGCACNAAVYMHTAKTENLTQLFIWIITVTQTKFVVNIVPRSTFKKQTLGLLAITPHKCDDPENKHYNACDGGGCARNLYKHIDPKLYGPGSEYGIDTNYAFKMNFSFVENDAGNLDRMETRITGKDGKEHLIVHDEAVCGKGYLEWLTGSLREGYTLVASNWGTLDVPPCDKETSCNNGAFTFGDLQVYEKGMK